MPCAELPSLEMTCFSSFICKYISLKLLFSLLIFQFCLSSYSWLTNQTPASLSFDLVNHSYDYRPNWTSLDPLPLLICFAFYGNYRQGLKNLFSWFLFDWPRCFFVVWAPSSRMLAHLLTMFLVQIHNISALLLIYNIKGLINTTLK